MLRHIIRAEVEGWADFGFLGITDADGAAGTVGLAPSEGSPSVWLLFFFFAILIYTAMICRIRQLTRESSTYALSYRLPEATSKFVSDARESQPNIDTKPYHLIIEKGLERKKKEKAQSHIFHNCYMIVLSLFVEPNVASPEILSLSMS